MLRPKRSPGATARRQASPRLVAALLLLAAAAVSPLLGTRAQGGCDGLVTASPDGALADPPELILLQRRTTDVHTGRPNYIAENIDHIESLPFDGMVVNIEESWSLMLGRPVSYDVIAGSLMPLRGTYEHFRHNFVEVLVDDPGDVFDDEAWAITVDNWRNMARAAREAGFVGIFFDNEEYKGRWLDYDEDYDDPSHTLEEYRDQTRLRGRQIMEAIVAEFPNVVLLVYHGPYVSEPATPDEVLAGQADAESSDLTGPLFVGFLEGLSGEARLVDGGEVYAYRTPEDFARSYEWRKRGIASEETDSAFIPPAARAVWEERVGISFGVYNLPFPRGEEMNPRIMRATLENALRQADDFVWFYTYGDNWLIPGDMPDCWFYAVEGARAAVGLPTASPMPGQGV
jgi:hypothetical protein